MSEPLGQPVLVENRPGGAGTVALGATVRAEPDGHTIFYGSRAVSILPHLIPNPGFDVARDLAPVSLIYEAPLLVVAGRGFAPNTAAEIIAAARAAPGKIDLGHPGNGTTNHLAAARFVREAGVEIVLVPFAGNAGVLNALLRGDVGLAFDTIATAAPLMREGQIRAIAVTGATRSPTLPEVPTVAETGLPGYEAVFWNAILAPAATPPDAISRLNAAVEIALRQPEVVARVREIGSDPAGGPPSVLARRFAADMALWGRVIREGNLRAE
jgi:tripartite-type tricarboxylate transporter receptor subunit TctC